jgi:hypothetical protein
LPHVQYDGNGIITLVDNCADIDQTATDVGLSIFVNAEVWQILKSVDCVFYFDVVGSRKDIVVSSY